MRYFIAIVIAIVLVIGGSFYWFQYRPASIVKRCQYEYDREFERLRDVNCKYNIKAGVTLTKEHRRLIYSKTKNVLWSANGIKKTEWETLPDDIKGFFEKKRFNIEQAEMFRNTAKSIYEECLRRKGLNK